ncbi:MAG: phosphoribosyltransferase, partial [Desulfobulbia bacterium]
MNDIRVFANRAEAGRDLADVLSGMELKDPVVFALPRGGVPVALEIAHALRAPIDLILVRKIGVPWQPELAAGAVVDGGHPEVVLNEDVIKLTGMSHKSIDKQIAQKLKEIEKRQ